MKQLDIIPPELAIRAMRDSGYRNTAYALAELIDNSVQAGASHVQVIGIEEPTIVKERERMRLAQIAVLDNGEGMTPEVLHLALQFGNGTRLKDRSGIGRFGMGLPNSSISQCRRVDVWTWQSGPDNAVHTCLDVDEIEGGKMQVVPPPSPAPLPDEWRKMSSGIGTSGTFVVWSKFDEHRLTWRGAAATLRNTETIVGRMYRKFIDDGKLTIRLLELPAGNDTYDENVRVNDPLYLMKNSVTPPPFNKKPMFEEWGEGPEFFEITYKGSEHKVTVRASMARKETVPSDRSDRGGKPYGQHARKNLGVSIVRAGRELDLDASWTSASEPRDRWWGIEVEFPPALDEIFGVTNSKQGANNFSQLSQFNWKTDAEPGETFSSYKDRLHEEGDPRSLLLDIAKHIQDQIGSLRSHIKDQTKGSRGANRHEDSSSADQATTKFRERAEQGHETDVDSATFGKKESDALERDLVGDKNYPEDIAHEISQAVLKRKRKVIFLTKGMDGYAFFSVEHYQGGLTAIVFNTNHPLYDRLHETLRPDNSGDSDASDADLLRRIHRAADTIELLFSAWARYELEEVGSKEKQLLNDMRQEWGKMARFFLTDLEE